MSAESSNLGNTKEKQIMLRLFSTLFILLAFPFLANAHYPPVLSCGVPHSKLPMKTHAQQFVEDLSAPRDRRIRAMECLMFYGRRGVRVLSRVLERELDNPDSMSTALWSLGTIQDRSVMGPMLRLLDYESRGSQQSGADRKSTSSRKIKLDYKVKAVTILADLAFDSLEVPNTSPPTTEVHEMGEFIVGWIGNSTTLSRRHYFRGERLGRYEIHWIAAVLKEIAESEPQDTTEAEKQFFQAASKGLARIEERMALLKKYGPHPYQPFKRFYFDPLDFSCPAPAVNRLSFCYRRGEGTIFYPSLPQTEMKSSNNIRPFNPVQFREPSSDPRPFCRNPFHNH